MYFLFRIILLQNVEKKGRFILLNNTCNSCILRDSCGSFVQDCYVNSEKWQSSFSNRKWNFFFFILKIPHGVVQELSPFRPCDAGCWRPHGSNPAYSRLYSQASTSQKAITWSGTWRTCVSQCFSHCLSKAFAFIWRSANILNWLIACFPFLGLTTSPCWRVWLCWKSSVRSWRPSPSWNTTQPPHPKQHLSSNQGNRTIMYISSKKPQFHPATWQ